jgi:hypothetical protein
VLGALDREEEQGRELCHGLVTAPDTGHERPSLEGRRGTKGAKEGGHTPDHGSADRTTTQKTWHGPSGSLMGAPPLTRAQVVLVSALSVAQLLSLSLSLLLVLVPLLLLVLGLRRHGRVDG